MKQIIKLAMIIYINALLTKELKAEKLELSTNSKIEQNAASGIGDFFKIIGNAFLDIGRPVWGSYKVNGQNNSSPIALFKRTTFEKDKKDIIDRIKVSGSDFWKIYQDVFKNGTNLGSYTIPAATGEAQKYETRATFAKNAAFVLVMK